MKIDKFSNAQLKYLTNLTTPKYYILIPKYLHLLYSLTFILKVLKCF